MRTMLIKIQLMDKIKKLNFKIKLLKIIYNKISMRKEFFLKIKKQMKTIRENFKLQNNIIPNYINAK